MVLVSGLFQVAQSGFFLRLWRGESVGVADMLASMADDGFLRKVGGMLWVQLQVFPLFPAANSPRPDALPIRWRLRPISWPIAPMYPPPRPASCPPA